MPDYVISSKYSYPPSFYVTFCIHDTSGCHVWKCTCLMTVFSIVTVFSDTCCLVCQTCGPCKAQRHDVRVFRRGPRERYGELRKSDSASCCFRKRNSIALLCSWRRPYQGDREKKLLPRPRPSVCLWPIAGDGTICRDFTKSGTRALYENLCDGRDFHENRLVYLHPSRERY